MGVRTGGEGGGERGEGGGEEEMRSGGSFSEQTTPRQYHDQVRGRERPRERERKRHK